MRRLLRKRTTAEATTHAGRDDESSTHVARLDRLLDSRAAPQTRSAEPEPAEPARQREAEPS